MSFNEQVSKLHAMRLAFRKLQKVVDESHDEWRAENDHNITHADQAKVRLAEAEDALRVQIVQNYEETGNKKPHPKLGVRVSEVPVYDGDKAVEFTISHVPQLLKLDRVSFNSYAKGVRSSAPLSFVEWDEKVTPTIAKDLG